jgi:hypothetical protein
MMAFLLKDCFGLEGGIISRYCGQIQVLVHRCFPCLTIDNGRDLADNLEYVALSDEEVFIPQGDLNAMRAFVFTDSGDRLSRAYIESIVPEMILALRRFGKRVTAKYSDYLPLSVHIYDNVSHKVSMGLLYKKSGSQSVGTPWHGALELKSGKLQRARELNIDGGRHAVCTVQPYGVPFPLAYVIAAMPE